MSHLKKPILLLAMSGWLISRPGTAAAEPQRPEVLWSLERRDLGFFDWRPRLAQGRGGEAWLGGAAPPGEDGGWLYRRHQGRWARWEGSPTQRARTFALDVDPMGALWVCDYSPTDDTTYGGLRVRRYDGRRWRVEVVRPGVWPQAISMVSPEEGWIGGNHGELLHLRAGRWRREILPLRRRHGTNVLALRMTGREAGWLAGTHGLVARYREGRWRMVPVQETIRREEIYALDTDPDGRLWVVGSHGLIASYGVTGWRRFASPGTFRLMDVAMTTARDGWIVGEHGTILRWDGRDWRRQPSPTLADLYALATTSTGEGWIAGNDLILRASPQRPWFREVSEQPRYAAALPPGRKVAAVDADGDGDLDLFSFQTASLRLYGNQGAEGFFAVPGLAPPPLATFEGFSWGDLDGDGDLDLLVQGRAPGAVWLYRNQGDLRFAGPERMLPGSLGVSHSSALVDLDRDGLPELFLGRGHGRFGYRVHRNDGAGRFRDAPAMAEGGTGMGAGLLTLWGDLDGDLDLDGVLPGDGLEIQLLLNQAGRLRDATRAAGLAGALRRGRILQGGLLDLDLDGDLDLLLLGDRLYAFLNDGEARFRRDDGLFGAVANNPAIPSTLSAFGDLDGDGFPEVLLQPVTGRREVRLFSRGRDGRYRDAAARAGLRGLTGDAAVFADWDGDGDLDLYLADASRGRLLENVRGGAGFLTVRPRGDRGGRSAAGARVRVYDAGHLGEAAFLRGHQQAAAGFNPSGVPPPDRLTFGLPAGRRYDVEAVFPGGRKAVARAVSPGRILDLFESPPGARQIGLARSWARRTWLLADRRREAVKLVLALAALAAWRSLAGRRFGDRALARRWSLSAGLLTAGLLFAGAFAADDRAWTQALQIHGFLAVLALLALLDSRLAAWRSSRYLGSYRLLEPLGEGGMGVVYRARDVVSGRTVALKALHPRRTQEEEHRLRFLREARILARLDHPNIVRVFDAGEAAGRGYLCMELLTGEPLGRLLRKRGPLPPDAVRELLAAAAGALGYVHEQGIVHRDVKSDNLFLVESGASWGSRVRLMDFGLARSAGARSLTDRQALLGTLAYMPPEQIRGEALDARSDLYSLGVVGYEALTGRLPFEDRGEGELLARIQTADPEPLRRLRPDVPADLARTIESMLARDPAGRPASARALSERLAGSDEVWTEPVPDRPGLGANPERYHGSEEAAWRRCYREARRQADQGRSLEAQVLMMDCLEEIRSALLDLSPEQREAYSRRHGVTEALDFMNRLSPG